MTNKTIYIHVLANTVECLIPKKKGKGYLKTPLYHNHVPAFTDMSKDVGCDIFGLDGTLYFQTGYVKRDDAIVYKIGDLVSKHYGFPYEIVNHKTFFDALENNYVRV